MKRPRFEIYPSPDGWRWRLRAANGKILCQGESHTRASDAKRAIKTLRYALARAKEIVKTHD